VSDLDNKDKELLNLIQKQIPLVKRPFKKIGDLLGITEKETIKRISVLKKEKIIREIRGIFNAETLGYKSVLAAFEVEGKNLENAVKIINSHPGVSHNYLRNHRFNIWFTLALPSEMNLEKTIRKMYRLSKAKGYLILPALRVFKIGVNLDAAGKETVVARKKHIKRFDSDNFISELSSLERACVRQLQNDLPLEPEPFKKPAKKIGMSQSDFIKIAKRLIDRKTMRRMAGVLYHRNLGFKFNAMVVWKAGEKQIDKCGRIMASFDAVSHCYRRPIKPNWPYSLFTVLHARKEKDRDKIVKEISKKTRLKNYKILSSLKEFKKKKIAYFSDEFHDWDKRFIHE